MIHVLLLAAAVGFVIGGFMLFWLEDFPAALVIGTLGFMSTMFSFIITFEANPDNYIIVDSHMVSTTYSAQDNKTVFFDGDRAMVAEKILGEAIPVGSQINILSIRRKALFVVDFTMPKYVLVLPNKIE